MQWNHTYLVIDLKSFYASVECAERGLNPMTANLVVADESRTDKTICLAVSPSLKAYGIPGRARLFEVVQRVKEINAERLQRAVRSRRILPDAAGTCHFSGSSFDADELAADPTLELTYVVAPPRMAKYIEVSGLIHSIYLRYISSEDIHSYSIDEAFFDVTGYLDTYRMTARELAAALIREVLFETHVTAAAGIGTNLYLAKIAVDIRAKHIDADPDGVRIAELDPRSYRRLLWDHRPLTDFWRIGRGTARTLAKQQITSMGELARLSVRDPEWLYQTFGIDAEILIDHAWGLESCTMKDIKDYRADSNSLCEGQVLSSPYSCEKARIIIREMAEALCLQMTEKELVTDSLTMDIGYDRQNVDSGEYRGQIHTDRYGRSVPAGSHGTIRLNNPTNLDNQIILAAVTLYDRIVRPKLWIRRLTITANRVVRDEGFFQYDLFTDREKEKKEQRLQTAMLSLKKKYGKNAVLRGTDLEEGATARQRNEQIGGHKA